MQIIRISSSKGYADCATESSASLLRAAPNATDPKAHPSYPSCKKNGLKPAANGLAPFLIVLKNLLFRYFYIRIPSPLGTERREPRSGARPSLRALRQIIDSEAISGVPKQSGVGARRGRWRLRPQTSRESPIGLAEARDADERAARDPSPLSGPIRQDTGRTPEPFARPGAG